MTIPRLTIPSFGTPLRIPRKARPYSHRKVRAARMTYLVAKPLCERCGALAMHVHHRIAISAGGHPYDFGNLEALCIPCHYQAHGKVRGRPMVEHLDEHRRAGAGDTPSEGGGVRGG